MSEYKYADITENVIGWAMRVHNYLGSGFQEVIYQRALEIEFNSKNIAFQREHEMPVFYYEHQIGTRRVDFFVEDKIMVELKAVSSLDKAHFAQAINYLEAYKMEVGLLINFGTSRLEFKRVYNQKLLQ